MIITNLPLDLHFKIIGTLLMALALVHAIFPRYFNWKEELKGLSLMNRQMMKIHTFFIALMVFMIGALCFFSTDDLINTHLGKILSLGLGVFWLIRFVLQLFGYSSVLWKGKTFETVVHVIFTFFWAYLTGVFALNYLQ